MANIPDRIKEIIKQKNPAVRHLKLSNLGLDDNDCSELHELLQDNQYIESIDLSNNNIRSDGCRFIVMIPKLKNVDFSHCSISDEGVEALIKINNDLHELNLNYCDISEDGAKLLLENLDKFNSLRIIGNPKINSETLTKIRSKFVKDPRPDGVPIGIDLGLNIHSVYQNIFYPNLAGNAKRNNSTNAGENSNTKKLRRN